MSPTASPAQYRIGMFVVGTPLAQPRPRARGIRLANGKVGAQIYNEESEPLKKWKDKIKSMARSAPSPPDDVPLRVDLDFLFPRPQRLRRKSSIQGRIPHTAKPDRDNLDKLILDALAGCLWTGDDSRVAQGDVRKWYIALRPREETPGVLIRVSESLYYPPPITRESIEIVR